MKRRFWTKEQDLELITAIMKGEYCKDIGPKMGRTLWAIEKRLTTLGVSALVARSVKAKTNISPQEYLEKLDYYAKGAK